MSHSASARAVFDRVHAMMCAHDAAFVDCFAVDAVLELPLATPGMPRRIVGREAIRAHVERAFRALRGARGGANPALPFGRAASPGAAAADGLRVYGTDDPEVVIAELTLRGQPPDGASDAVPFIQVMRVRAGEVVEMRDYFDAFARRMQLAPPASGPSPRRVVQQLLAAISESRWDAAAALYAQDATVMHPMDPPGHGQLNGAAALRAHFEAARALPITMQARDLVIHETADPEVVVTEFRYVGRVTTTGRAFQIANVFVVRVRDGLIVASRDYGDHLAFSHAIGRMPELLARLDRVV